MTQTTLNEQELNIQNQYPHLSVDEIREYLSRTPANHLKNMYPHLDDEAIVRIMAQSKPAEEPRPNLAVATGIFDQALVDKILSGQYLEEIKALFSKYFPFLDIEKIVSDVEYAVNQWVEEIKQNPEFQIGIDKMKADYQRPVMMIQGLSPQQKAAATRAANKKLNDTTGVKAAQRKKK